MSAMSIADMLKVGRSFSLEFMPPRTDQAAEQLWRAIRQLEPLKPTFVSVTYGAGGSTRDRTVQVTAAIAEQTSLNPVAHLTVVNHSVAELRHVIGSYAAVGVGHRSWGCHRCRASGRRTRARPRRWRSVPGSEWPPEVHPQIPSSARSVLPS